MAPQPPDHPGPASLPVARGRRWAFEGSTVWLVGRGGARLGYLQEYDDGWGASMRTRSKRPGTWYLPGEGARFAVVMPGGFGTCRAAAAALLREMSTR